MRGIGQKPPPGPGTSLKAKQCPLRGYTGGKMRARKGGCVQHEQMGVSKQEELNVTDRPKETSVREKPVGLGVEGS